MAVKLFLLGLPGSGKSTAARYITTYAKDWQWLTTRFNDYVILQEMFCNDTEGKQFKPSCHGAFDVIDLTVFDTGLKRLEQQVNSNLSSSVPEEIILIEFARSDYQKAFGLFSYEFLQDAYFLYLDTEIDACKVRIHDRITNPTCDDDYNVSEYIFSAYYYKNNGQYLPEILERDYGVDKQRIVVIENNRTLQEVSPEINSVIDFIIESASVMALSAISSAGY
jgi:thymidylate kinase